MGKIVSFLNVSLFCVCVRKKSDSGPVCWMIHLIVAAAVVVACVPQNYSHYCSTCLFGTFSYNSWNFETFPIRFGKNSPHLCLSLLMLVCRLQQQVLVVCTFHCWQWNASQSLVCLGSLDPKSHLDNQQLVLCQNKMLVRVIWMRSWSKSSCRWWDVDITQ